jgi:hypothetical protein
MNNTFEGYDEKLNHIYSTDYVYSLMNLGLIKLPDLKNSICIKDVSAYASEICNLIDLNKFVFYKTETLNLKSEFSENEYNFVNHIKRLLDENKKFNDAVLVENWIVTSENDKIYDMGFNQLQIPIGSWVGGYYILETKEGNKIWEMIKDGTIRGFSVEGSFELKFYKHVLQKNEDDILLEEIINILSSIED